MPSNSNTNDDSLDQYVVMATIGKPHGLKGHNCLQTHSDQIDALLKYSQWWVRSPKEQDWSPIQFEDVCLHHKKLIARLNQTHTPESATQYTGQLIGIHKDQLPSLEEDDYYHYELIGLQVIHTDGTCLGTLTHIWSNGAHDVFEVKGSRTRIIPYIHSVIQSIDLTEKIIEVDWPHDF